MKLPWRAVFLAVTAVAIGMECWASWDGNPNTDPWTDLIVRYVPWEAALAVFGGLAVWLVPHFWVRYQRKRSTANFRKKGAAG